MCWFSQDSSSFWNHSHLHSHLNTTQSSFIIKHKNQHKTLLGITFILNRRRRLFCRNTLVSLLLYQTTTTTTKCWFFLAPKLLKQNRQIYFACFDVGVRAFAILLVNYCSSCLICQCRLAVRLFLNSCVEMQAIWLLVWMFIEILLMLIRLLILVVFVYSVSCRTFFF